MTEPDFDIETPVYIASLRLASELCLSLDKATVKTFPEGLRRAFEEWVDALNWYLWECELAGE